VKASREEQDINLNIGNSALKVERRLNGELRDIQAEYGATVINLRPIGWLNSESR